MIEERRFFVRAKYPCKIIIYTPEKHIIDTHTEDISGGGIRVVIEEKLEISSLVDLEIYLKEEPIICKGRVVWVLEKESICQKGFLFFDTGIEFYEIKEKDRLIIKKLVEAIVDKE